MVIASFLTKLYNRMIEGQMQRARREIAMHSHLLPREMEVFGNRLVERNEDALPFGR
jgi:hypothetical protein